MSAFDAEIQVDGYCEPLDTFTLIIEQSVDYEGSPNSGVLIRPIRFTITGLAAMLQFFVQWATEHHMRRTGHIIVYQNGQVRWRLTFYDAWCILHNTCFLPGDKGGSLQLVMELSPAAVNVNGIHSEITSDLWWEKNAVTRFNALAKPPEILPSPNLRASFTPSPNKQLYIPKPNRLIYPQPPKNILDPNKKPLYSRTISKWYKEGGFIDVLENGDWKYTDWERNYVIYEGNEPNYGKHVVQEVDIDDMQGDCTTDFDKADAKAPNGPKADENTWHHKQNMKTMQEIDFIIHKRFTHFGARSIIKKTKRTASAPKKTFTKRRKS